MKPLVRERLDRSRPNPHTASAESWHEFPLLTGEGVRTMVHGGSVPKVGAILSLEGLGNEKFVVNSILKGGMGVVYQLVPVRPPAFGMSSAWPCEATVPAQDIEHAPEVLALAFPVAALKTFQVSADREAFKRECEIWISLSDHPFVAKAFWYGECFGKPAVLSEWYDATISECPTERWGAADVLRLSIQVVEALRYAYRQHGVIHQDIKPSNILLDTNRRPRLADFGLARFARSCPTACRGIADVRSDMHRAVSFGSVAGTPLYMAPELFTGPCKTSIRSDIYSLGVTLYELVTKQHPYLGRETNWQFSPSLRTGPLDPWLQREAGGGRRLASIVVRMVSLDLAARPSDYEEILEYLGAPTKPYRANARLRAERAVGMARTYRVQGRFAEAHAVLQRALDADPENPVLLNGYAILLLSQGETGRAIKTIKESVEVLRRQDGVYGTKVYCDPAVNLARQLIVGSQFQAARRYLAMAWGWLDSASDRLGPHLYNEFGWMFLYEGDFQRASEHIIQTYRYKEPDDLSLLWLTLASWLDHSLETLGPQLAGWLTASRPLAFSRSVCACLVAAHLPDNDAGGLLGIVDEDRAEECATIERQAGLGIGGMRPPCSDQALSLIVRSLDKASTGGRYCGSA